MGQSLTGCCLRSASAGVTPSAMSEYSHSLQPPQTVAIILIVVRGPDNYEGRTWQSRWGLGHCPPLIPAVDVRHCEHRPKGTQSRPPANCRCPVGCPHFQVRLGLRAVLRILPEQPPNPASRVAPSIQQRSSSVTVPDGACASWRLCPTVRTFPHRASTDVPHALARRGRTLTGTTDPRRDPVPGVLS